VVAACVEGVILVKETTCYHILKSSVISISLRVDIQSKKIAAPPPCTCRGMELATVASRHPMRGELLPVQYDLL
jgi:hypothetical protein